jgi:hypothetical protein
VTTVAEPHVDIAVTRPLRMGLQLANGEWIDLTLVAGDAVRERTVRIQAVDLRSACAHSSALREEATARDEGAISVLVDIEVMIDDDARSAREALDRLNNGRPAPQERSLAYVGTAKGLAGLIADMHVLHIADGVTLVPLTVRVLERIVHDALPVLRTMGFDAPAGTIDVVRRSLPAQRVAQRSA